MSKKETVELTQDEMEIQIRNYFINRYIKEGTVKNITPEDIESELNISIDKDAINDFKRGVGLILIENEITAQGVITGQDEEFQFIKDVSKSIVNFDFSKYEDMSIEEIREYIYVYDENIDNGELTTTDKLLVSHLERACVGVYALLKGGSTIEKNEVNKVDSVIDIFESLLKDGKVTKEHKKRLLELIN